MLTKNSIAILIPAFNEESTIGAVVRKSLHYGQPFVVDDGSIDNTAKHAKENGAEIIKNKKNLGYDRSIIKGLMLIKKKKYKFVITIDADGQHSVNDLKKFISSYQQNYDLVIGFRENYQRFSEYIFSLAGILLWKIKDPLCGMKGYRLSILKSKFFLKLEQSIGTEIAIRVIKDKKKFIQHPIKIRLRKDHSRFGNGFFVNIKMIKILIKLIIKYF